MKLNEFQRAAVAEPPKNITVSAAAGSGKTQVLGERVLARVTGERPVDVNRLLIVTFTRSAAAELRSRVGASLSEALRAEADPDRRRALERQLALLGGADVCTIDSFCYRLLRQNFFKIPNLSGDFSVGDEEAVRSLRADVLRGIVEMFSAAAAEKRGEELIPAYAEKAAEFARLYPDGSGDGILVGFERLSMNYGSPKRANDFTASRTSGKSDYIDLVYELKRGIEAVPDPEKWLADCAAACGKDFSETALGRYAAEAASSMAADVLFMLKNAAGELKNPKNAGVFASAIAAIEALPRPETYAEARKMLMSRPLLGLRVSAKDTKTAKGDPAAAEVMSGARKIWDKTAELFAPEPEKIETFRAEIAPAAAALCEMTRLLISGEIARMMEKKTLSFSACVQLALRLLVNRDGSPSETALELRELYDEIYVDEAQDVDPRQLAIFEAVSRGRLFMVGDVKQSIYGFRHAEPAIFNSRCAASDEGSRLIPMNLNYRSCAEVINTVNGVFRRLINESTMDSDYASSHEMLHGEDWLPEGGGAEFISVVDADKSARSYDFALEAQAAANRINELLVSGMTVFDKAAGRIRPIMKKDIIVLMRAVKDDGPLMRRALEDNGIAAYFDGGEGLYSKAEISPVVDVLTLLDNDGRDIPLAGALRSVMFGFTENELLKIRAAGDGGFSDVFRSLADPNDPLHAETAASLDDAALLERCLDFGEKLRRWRRAADFSPISEVVNMITAETGYYSSVGAMKGGAGRANLDALTDAAEAFEASGQGGLYGFLEHIKRQNLSPTPSATEAKTLSEAMDVVRVMSIHKSKGLEAPVVMLVKCSKPFAARSPDCAVSARLGFSMDYVDEEAGFLHRSPLSALIGLERRMRERREEIRLLYVAMTRPRQRLILTGYFPNEKALEAALAYSGSLTSAGAVFLTDSYAKMLGSSLADESLFAFKRLSASDVRPPSLAKKLGSAPLGEDVAANFASLMGFDYEYPYPTDVPAKVSVSALRAAPPDEDAAESEFSAAQTYFPPLKKPAFLVGERPPTPAEMGTAYHSVMERLDFSRPAREQIDALAKLGIISEAEHKLINVESVDALLNSPLGARMRAAELRREAPFMINLPAGELGEGFPAASGETVAVQGIIDCWFIEGDTAVIVDYKTDRYESPSEVAQKYKKQLEYYSKAIKMKFSDKKIQKYLYLFYKGDIIEV